MLVGSTRSTIVAVEVDVMWPHQQRPRRQISSGALFVVIERRVSSRKRCRVYVYVCVCVCVCVCVV